MKSLFGFDMNFDGKKNFLDDILFMHMMDEDEKRKKKADAAWVDEIEEMEAIIEEEDEEF